MSELRYPNESQEYRKAREALLKDEQELVAKTKAVAEKRRKLPPGGQLKEDYAFQWADGGKVGQRVKFSELFGDKTTLHPLLMDVRPELGQALPVLHVADGWVRPRLVFGRAGRRVRHDRQGAARKNRRVGEGARLVADPAAVRLTSRRFRPTTSARARTTTCNCR